MKSTNSVFYKGFLSRKTLPHRTAITCLFLLMSEDSLASMGGGFLMWEPTSLLQPLSSPWKNFYHMASICPVTIGELTVARL